MKISIKSNINVSKHLRKVRDPTFWKYGATEWWRLITPYTPMGTGTMSEQVTIKGESGNGLVEYNAPYAHYLYRGELMVDPDTGSSYARKGAKKVYIGTELVMSKERHPLASKEWDKAAEPTQKPKLIDVMQKYVDSGRLNLSE